MAFEQPYPIPPETAIASYAFTDIASGSGFEKFWLAAGEDTGAIRYLLTTLNLTSEVGRTQSSTSSTLATSFDTSTFNLPRTVKGIAYANIDLHVNSGSSGHNYSIKLQVVHADDSTTDISSTITSADTALVSATRTFLLEIPLTQTGIKKGEKIRAIVTINEGASDIMWLHHSGSDSSIQIPFRIDL